jgi:hypothetical protein
MFLVSFVAYDVRTVVTAMNEGRAVVFDSEKNMEAGVLIDGGPVPKTLSDHLQALIDVGVIDRV